MIEPDPKADRLGRLFEQSSSASKWAVLAQVAGKGSMLIVVVLTYFLDQAEIGVVGLSGLILLAGQQILELGLGIGLIQTREDRDAASHVVFYTNLVLGLLVFGLTCLLAPALARLFDEPLIATILPVHAVLLLLVALGSVHTALLQRDFAFKKLFWVRLPATLVPAAVSIPMAIQGWGPWALVAGHLTGGLVQLVLLWWVSSFRPRLSFDRRLAGRLYRFGSWVACEQFFGFLSHQGDSLLLGKFMGSASLGIYRVGSQLVNAAFTSVVEPIANVAYPLFCRVRDDEQERERAYRAVSRLVNLLTLAILVIFIGAGEPAAAALLGVGWGAVGSVLQWFSISMALSVLLNFPFSQTTALGRPDLLFKTRVGLLFFQLPAYAWAARQDLETFLQARVAVALVTFAVYLLVLRLALGLRVGAAILEQHRVIGLSLLWALLLVLVDARLLEDSVSPWTRLFILIPSVGLGLLAIVRCFEWPFVRRVWELALGRGTSAGEQDAR